jgi:DNA-directed RNA polymerase II subunit RPB1
LDRELDGVKVYPEGIDQLMDRIVRKVRMVEPAKSVGIICGQSIGEMQTQTTLNTFHKTGLTEKLVVAGVPRFLEIIDTNRSETQGTPSAYIYFRTPLPQTIAETRAHVGSSLVSYTLEKLIVDWSVETELTAEIWDIHDLHTNPTVASYPWHLRLHLNREVLFRYTLTLDQVAQRITQMFPTYIVRCSPLFLGRLDVFPVATFSDPSVLEDQIYPALIHISVCGVDRIQNIFFLRTTTTPVEWYLETDGSNLEEILNLPFVDSYRTYSNDIWEIYNLFGIEAVRAYIVEELTQLMPTIHRTHITLLADRMTVSGRLRSISRYTRKHEHSSVLSKATFEETLSGFLRSGMMNEVDTVNGSSASIICGRIPKVGTGLNDLML